MRSETTFGSPPRERADHSFSYFKVFPLNDAHNFSAHSCVAVHYINPLNLHTMNIKRTFHNAKTGRIVVREFSPNSPIPVDVVIIDKGKQPKKKGK